VLCSAHKRKSAGTATAPDIIKFSQENIAFKLLAQSRSPRGKEKELPQNNVLGKPALLLVVSLNLLREKQKFAKQSETRNLVSKNLWANKTK
jgi:hypothetical protein